MLRFLAPSLKRPSGSSKHDMCRCTIDRCLNSVSSRRQHDWRNRVVFQYEVVALSIASLDRRCDAHIHGGRAHEFKSLGHPVECPLHRSGQDWADDVHIQLSN
jgi:hypothetical protein